jgi:hypothetical protein
LRVQQDISEAFDEAARKYFDETEEKDRDDVAVTSLMRTATKAKAVSYGGKFSKYVDVANPKLGDKFLEEVKTTLYSSHCKKFHDLVSAPNM